MIQLIPYIDASLNLTAFILILIGIVLAKKGHTGLHRLVMTLSLLVSATFLGFYLYYHFNSEPVKFQGEGAIRYAYYIVLFTHIVAAALVPVLVPRAAYLGYKNQLEKHRKAVKLAVPVWLYTSITGVMVFYFLYLWPS